MALLDTAPYLIPVYASDALCVYSGFVNLLNQSYRLEIHVPKENDLSQASLFIEWRLRRRIKDKINLINQRLQKAASISSFLNDFVTICESCLKVKSEECTSWMAHTHRFLHQIQALGWDRVVSIGNDFSSIEIACNDSQGRQHFLTVNFDQQDPSACPNCVTKLPKKFDFHWSAKSEISDIVQQFEASLETYQTFWSVVADIDQNTWILEPERPTFACTHRRIALGPHTSLHITINPLQPTSLPECRLLGPESAVSQLREKLNINVHRWDLDRSLIYNLQDALEVDFPTPTDTKKEELIVACGICYSHHLGEEIPDNICENKKCSQAFHHLCLFEWLRNSACRQSFNYLFGECPFCTQPIRVKLLTD